MRTRENVGADNIQYALSTLESLEMLRRLIAAIAVVLVPGMVENAGAAIQNGDQIIIDRTANHNSGPVNGDYDTDATWGDRDGGGEFRVREITGPGPTFGEIFKTFCIEKNENINLPGTYYATLDGGAVQGGNSGGNPDPLSSATKWLYYWYVNNMLDTFGDLDPDAGTAFYAYDNQSSANELQEAIWNLEGEIGSTTGLATHLINKASAQGAFNVANASVLVLNLWSAYPVTNPSSQRRQSQLYFTTTQGGNEIPEPASMAIWGVMALGGVVAFRRRAA